MIDTDKPAFFGAFATLCKALREKDPDAPQVRIYFDALKDLDLELVQMAAVELAKAAQWFPKTSEWREMARKVERQQLLEQNERLRKLHLADQYLCTRCDDTGMARGDDNRYGPCACRKLRRMEVLGLRPMPEPPAALPAGDPEQIERALAMAREAVRPL